MRIGSFSGAGLGFGLAFSLIDDFSHNARRIERQMQQLIGTSGKLAMQTEAAMARMRTGVMGLGLALGMFFGWQKAIAADATFQNLELGFRSFLPTAKAASDFFKQIQSDAIENPKFSIEGMAKANLMLVSQGIAAEKSRQSIKDLSMILLGVGRGEPELQRVAMALEKIETAKFLEGPQLRSLTTAGLPVVKMLKDIGVTLDPSHVKKAKISFDQLTEAFHNAVQPGQQFGRVAQMLEGNVSALGAQIRESFQVTLANIGESIRPVTLALLDMFGRLLTSVREFAQSPIGKTVFRIAFAMTLVLAAVSSLIIATNLFRWAMFRVAAILGAVDKLVFLRVLAQGKYRAAFAVLGRAISAAIPALTAMIAKFALLTLGMQLMSRTNDGLLYALGMLLAFVVGPFGAVIVIFSTISRSLKEFDAVMSGARKPAQGLLGLLQRIGGVFRFVSAAWAGFNKETNEVEVSKSLIKAMDELGMGDFARNAATWIGRIRVAWGGLVTGFGEAYGWLRNLAHAFGEFIDPVINGLFGTDAMISKNVDTLQKWKDRGRIAGRILFGVVAALTAGFLIQQGVLLVNAVVGVASFLAWAAPIILVTGLVFILIDAIRRIYNSIVGVDTAAESSFGGVQNAVGGLTDKLGTLGPQFSEVGKQLGTQLTSGIQSSMGDWWERFSSMDFSLWGGDSKKYHYVPFSPERSGWQDPVQMKAAEFNQSETGKALGRAVKNNAMTMAMSPAAGNLGAVAEYMSGLSGVVTRGTAAQGNKRIEVNLILDKKTVAKAVIDTVSEKAAVQYPWQSGYRMPGSDTGDQSAWTPPAFDE